MLLGKPHNLTKADCFKIMIRGLKSHCVDTPADKSLESKEAKLFNQIVSES